MASSHKDQPILETLSFAHSTPDGDINVTPDVSSRVRCLMCDEHYDVLEKQEELLKHLVLSHKLVVADVKLIADLKRYLDYWRKRFKEKPMTTFCSVIQTNSLPTDQDPSELYYLLCDVLPEDKILRTKLQQERLDMVLDQQRKEREDASFCRQCLFCKTAFTGSRSDLFNHMAFEHNLNLGKPDNLVYTDELLDLLEKQLQSLHCLYCEKTFKDRHVLKEHMRKKQHKKINPKNKTYDRFYIINYLELGKNWESLQTETQDVDIDYGSDVSSLADEWDDWTDDVGAQVVCLYCDRTFTSCDKALSHMKEIHQFDLNLLREELNLTFYQQVKLINYIRRQVHQKICPFCQEQLDSCDKLRDHMNFLGHVSRVADVAVWDQPQYYFPTFENDALLCGLEDNLDSSTTAEEIQDSDTVDTESVVIAEECPVKESVLMESDLRQHLLS